MLTNEDKKNFLDNLSEVLEVSKNSINTDSKLNEINWDSLSIIGCISIVDDLFEIRLTGEELSDAKDINDIIDLINKKF